jgi:dolichol-phosphate mannosyltransferase
LLVIPTYNERENLPLLIDDLLQLDLAVDILVVDDNSPDGTGRVADELAGAHPDRIRVLHRPAKQGIGPAYMAGFQLALASPAALIGQMDADRSHDPHQLPDLVAAVAGSDLALGSRYVQGGCTEGWPFHRRLISRLGGLYSRLVLGIPVRDLTGGYKVYRREVLEQIGLDRIKSDGYAFQIETTYRARRLGYSTAEVPIRFVDRVAGKSKLSRRIVVEACFVVWRLRFDRSIPTKRD